jgi:hypothetical protein
MAHQSYRQGPQQEPPCECHDCTQARWKGTIQGQMESAKGYLRAGYAKGHLLASRAAPQVSADREFLRAAMMKHFADDLSMERIAAFIYDVYPAKVSETEGATHSIEPDCPPSPKINRAKFTQLNPAVETQPAPALMSRVYLQNAASKLELAIRSLEEGLEMVREAAREAKSGAE